MSTDRSGARVREGWICPKCGAVYAPTWFECLHCRPTRGFVSNWTPPPSAVPERFRSTSIPRWFRA